MKTNKPNSNSGSKALVIVESPAKARTLGKILGSGYSVKASLGHVRDLPKSRLGVRVDDAFTPEYVVPKEKRKVVAELKQAAKEASKIYLATDPDREGEAISWHLVEAAKLDGIPLYRVAFHEITRDAVEAAFASPRSIDMHLVDAQQARRILDRLVGYKLSPLLWKKVRGRLSAGRVQSVALRMVADREREIAAFVPQEYWSIEAELTKKSPRSRAKASTGTFRAALIGEGDGVEKLHVPNAQEAERLTRELQGASYQVGGVRQKQVQRQPAPPFITSSLQQEAWRKLRFTAKRTMAVAQQLYEGLPVGAEGAVGLITYMRTDSTNVAASAVAETREFIVAKFGSSYLPRSPRTFKRKVKGAQEAHEAIRPTRASREPQAIRPYLTADQLRLYELVWKRMVASQMAAAVMDTTSVDVQAENKTSGGRYLLRASGSVTRFQGFLALYVEGRDDDAAENGDKRSLPQLTSGEPLELLDIHSQQHFTQPPPRYTEASLIKALEENGIGRPSTYAPILSTIQERGYVNKEKGLFHPLELGLVVNDLLQEHFPDVVDVSFTARMEGQLDEIARGEREWVPVLRRFYGPFDKAVALASSQAQKVSLADEISDETCDLCGRPMAIKVGRYGRFLACTGYPECKSTRPLRVKVGVKCPQCGGDMVQRRSKKGRIFYGCANYPRCSFTTWGKPVAQPCPQCGGLLALERNGAARCVSCRWSGKVAEVEIAEPVGV